MRETAWDYSIAVSLCGPIAASDAKREMVRAKDRYNAWVRLWSRR
ncbi:hypothetical protein [Curtobacterium sp. MCBD17_040]|nr:hypothetical protein [Curtobacterium sp. MCBD17_040]WIB65909.1 hypothetical protein DEI94_17490 [Curtobacterium sp. MCBD17_040]